jgi:hypothetical protein
MTACTEPSYLPHVMLTLLAVVVGLLFLVLWVMERE